MPQIIDVLRLLREEAGRIRRLAQTLSLNADREKLHRYAEELEQQVTESESQLGSESRPSASAPL